jgi:hypothetical protein
VHFSEINRQQGHHLIRSRNVSLKWVLSSLTYSFLRFIRKKSCMASLKRAFCMIGYPYLFDLGLSLRKGDDSLPEAYNTIGQSVVAEFSHFKEVLMMVWNEETSQKPAKNTVQHIKKTAKQTRYSKKKDILFLIATTRSKPPTSNCWRNIYPLVPICQNSPAKQSIWAKVSNLCDAQAVGHHMSKKPYLVYLLGFCIIYYL